MTNTKKHNEKTQKTQLKNTNAQNKNQKQTIIMLMTMINQKNQTHRTLPRSITEAGIV